MKKVILLLSILLLSVEMMAQSPITIGPKVGLNYSKLSSTDNNSNVDYSYFQTWSGGVFARASLGKLYLQPEGYFNTKGSDLQIRQNPADPATTNVNGRVRLSSLDVPLLIGYKLAEGKHKKSNIRIFGGPLASFVLKERENDLKLLDDNSYTFNKSNIGFQAGIGFDLGNLTFDARYEGGLNRINSYFNQRANLFQFSLGIKLF